MKSFFIILFLYYSTQLYTQETEIRNLKEFETLISGTKNPDSFYFSKYMCLLFLNTIYSKSQKELNNFSTDIMRYAASNTDISTFFIKVS